MIHNTIIDVGGRFYECARMIRAEYQCTCRSMKPDRVMFLSNADKFIMGVHLDDEIVDVLAGTDNHSRRKYLNFPL